MNNSSNVNNNYAAPHTPIASAKRPRNPRPSLQAKLGATTNGTTPQPPATPNANKIASTPSKFQSIPEGSLSPMHPARPMQSHNEDRENDDAEERIDGDDTCTGSSTWGNFFSPVLSFLGADKEEGEDDVADTSAGKETTDPLTVGGENLIDETIGTVEVTESSHLNDIVYDEDGDVSMNHDVDKNFQTHPENSKQNVQPQPQQQPQVPEARNVQESSTSDDEDDLQDYEDDGSEIEEEFNPYLFIKRLPCYYSVAPSPEQLRVHLPPKDPNDPRQTLVLDLDETLVHCTVEPNTPNVDMVFPVVFHGMEYQVHVKKRPYLKEFLERIYKEFEVVVFTASQRVYADELLDRIDPEKKYIKYRMFRESCLPVEGNYLKDLNVLGRDLSTAVLVDNSPHAFGYQVDNGIPIESWFDDPHDTELLKLEKFLRTLRGAQDVRPLVRAKFQTHRLIAEA